MLAGLYASLVHSKKIIITECGPTMYQPRFAPMDEITFTTHPMVLNAVKNILSEFLGNVKIILPFEDLTKSEVISNSPDKSIFNRTHSCITQRKRDHDGTCYGCVIRKLGAIVAGVKDVKYNYDVLSNDDSSKNYDTLFDFTKENIVSYDKKELFERFALDNFTALYIYYEIFKKKKSSFVVDLYSRTLKKLGKATFERRIKNVRKEKIKPKFKRRVE